MSQFVSRDFQCAFAAVSYLAGRRDADLLAPFPAPHLEARALQTRLSHPERERRAEALARELSRLVSSLSARAVK
ncbi:MAG TPA: hypothetical protein VFK05_01720 [Polyangiaceae bacterium]|nr:hypothetical protein [Polyangiaceae bacterium]